MYYDGIKASGHFSYFNGFEINETAAYEQLRGNTWDDHHKNHSYHAVEK